MTMLKFLYQPVSPFKINQRFGENQACVSTDGRNKVISCPGKPPAGYKKLYGPKGHLGLDLRATTGQEVYCALDGVINEIDPNSWSGLDVRVISMVGGITYRHIYEHLNGFHGKVGDKVGIGQIIGWAGNTGFSSATHLHFELQQWIDGKWVSIDPEPVMFDIYALTHMRKMATHKWMVEILAQVTDRLADLLRQSTKST